MLDFNELNLESPENQAARQRLTEEWKAIAEWEMLSDENRFEESYGEESDFYEAGSAEVDDVALFMDD